MSQGAGACPLCLGNANRWQIPDSTAIGCACPRCGSFSISHQLLVTLPRESPLLPYLAAFIRRANRDGREPPLTTGNWEDFARAHSTTPVSQKVSRLLSLLSERGRPGKPAPFDPRTDAPLLDSPDAGEALFLLQSLIDRKDIDPYRGSRKDLGATDYVLTIAGWNRLDPGPGGIQGRCFVAMAFADELREVYDQGIRPAIEEDCRPAHAVRLDRTEHNEKICDKIQVEIRLAEFLVADVTRQNPGVYFEAGFAMALGRPVIWTCREDDFENVHFDTRQYSHIVWKNPGHLRQLLATRVKGTIPSAVNRLGR